MEKIKTPISIRIIFILNEIIFWLFNLVSVLAIVAAFLVTFNAFGEGLQLQISLPVSFNADIDGALIKDNFSTEVRIVEAYGDIMFPGTPPGIARPFMLAMLIVIGAMYFMLFVFRKFIRSVNRGVIFESKNIRRLRILALSLLGFWFLWHVYDFLVKILIANHLNLGAIEITGGMRSHAILLIFSLVLWVLSQIFLKGLKLEEEASLTI